jgi:carboxypeptidase Taq
MTQSTRAYDGLCQVHARIHRFQHLLSLAHWDQASFMPPGGNEARTAALTELTGLIHRTRTDPALADLLARAQHENLEDWEAANLREMQRDWTMATALPDALVQRRSEAVSRCGQAWRVQRPANDWAGFATNLKQMLAVTREQAQLLSDRLGVAPYDALMNHYEPGASVNEVAQVFGEVRQWLPGLLKQILAHQQKQVVLPAKGPFPIAAQQQLNQDIMALLQFDFNAGRLDVSTHPFTGGVPEDVRMTTRFDEQDFLLSLMSTIHETGHGRYEQRLPRKWLGQPVGIARSMAIHESQSLSFEMQLCRHPGFARLLSPMLIKAFGAQDAFEPGNLYRLLTRVEPGFIRVAADEVTYPAHIILRFDIERALIAGEAQVDDIPALWDEGMRDLLGVDTRGNFADGPMQDVHWPEGLFGYFPCYSLGAMYAAQWFATMRREMPDLDDRIAAGDLNSAFNWLDAHIWSQGSRWTTPELARRASGETLNPAHFRAHLEARYLA